MSAKRQFSTQRIHLNRGGSDDEDGDENDDGDGSVKSVKSGLTDDEGQGGDKMEKSQRQPEVKTGVSREKDGGTAGPTVSTGGVTGTKSGDDLFIIPPTPRKRDVVTACVRGNVFVEIERVRDQCVSVGTFDDFI